MSHPLLQRVTRDGVTAEIETPAPDRLISGAPVHSTWSLVEEEDLFAGLWQSTPGKWRVTYEEWEYIRILEGHSVLTDADGHATHLKAGDSYIINRGFQGSWEVIETTLKEYVIRL